MLLSRIAKRFAAALWLWRRCVPCSSSVTLKRISISFCLVLLVVGFAEQAAARESGDGLSSMPHWQRVVLLRDYNTRVVLFGVGALGAASGLVGSFMLLRKRALMGDALSHASLPGIGLAFLIAGALGYEAKSQAVLLLGATVSGVIGVAVILVIRHQTRLKEDGAMGIVLSVFFGAGVALLAIAERSAGSATGLESFIYGKTASMRAADAQLIATASIVCLVGCSLLYKELKLLCFDEGFAGSNGFPVVTLDIALMFMVVLVTIVGLEAVGLVLMIALLVIPAAAALFWTESMWRMMLWSASLGFVGSVTGGLTSALLPRLPSGATIVLVCSLFFFISMLFGRRRGVVVRFLRRLRLNRRVDRQHLLRAMYEQIEDAAEGAVVPGPEPSTSGLNRKLPVSTAVLLSMRSWSRGRLLRAIERAEDDELLRRRTDGGPDNRVEACVLTQKGFAEAARLTRQHRLWEMYLIAYAEVATANVDRDADHIEHVLAPEVIDQLEELLDQQGMMIPVPASPHEVGSVSGDSSVSLVRGVT
ncbi:MAG: iron chelate uptake ABC transporter family permease subunit [Planctomycetota bacterium]